MRKTIADLLNGREYISEADGWVILCPGHSDSHPSLRIAIDDKGNLITHCRAGCAYQNYISKLIPGLSKEGWTVGEGIEDKSANSAGEPVNAEDLAWLESFISASERNFNTRALEYAERRWGISEEQASELRLGYSTTGDGYADHFSRAAVVVPFYDFRGVLRGMQTRHLNANITPKWNTPKNPDGRAWGKLAVFKPSNPIADYAIITEGPGDALSSYAVGYLSVGIRGAGLGSNELVRSQLKAGLAGKSVIIAGDNDRAGSNMVSDLLDVFPDALVLPIPTQYKDLSEWQETEPEAFPEGLTKAVRNAVPYAESSKAKPQEMPELPGNDIDMAQAIIDHFEHVCYIDGIGMYLWNGKVWEEIEPATLVYMFVVEMMRTYSQDGWQRWASAAKIKGVAEVLKFNPSIRLTADEIDSHETLINVKNGVFDVVTGELLPHDPKYHMTNMVPFDYVPDAKADRWEKFIEEIFPQDEMPEYIKRLIGYGVTGSTREECFVILHGYGSNGKSKFLEALGYVFDDYSVYAGFESFVKSPNDKIRNDVARMRGRHLVFANEGNISDHMDEAMLKNITGRDKVTARFLHKEYFEYTPKFLLILATNFKPQFQSQDKGLWRRVKYIPFTVTFTDENKDDTLGDKLKAEAEGILRWALEGAHEWYHNGLNDPELIKEEVAEFKGSANPMEGFIPGWFVRTGDPADKVKRSDVWRAYNVWTQEEAHKPWRQTTVNNHIEAMGVPVRKHQGTYVFVGLKWVGPEDESITLDELLRRGR